MLLFKSEQMYHFIAERFEGTSSNIQEQSLSWLQVNNIFSTLRNESSEPLKYMFLLFFSFYANLTSTYL